MSDYLLVKLVHVVSATILFGTGIGIAFFMLRSYLSGNRDAMLITARSTVLADWLFTTPAAVIQLVTGLWLTHALGIAFGSAWFVAVAALFVLVGACWLPVVWIQIRVRRVLARGGGPAECRALMRTWTALGVVAFTAMLALFWLMVTRTGVERLVFAG